MSIPAPPRARRQGKPHWGLRFLMLLFLVGGVTYFLRPSVPWIHARLSGVEAGVRSVAERYGLMTAPAAVTATPPAAPATTASGTVTTPAATTPSPEAKPAGPAAGAPGSRPEVTPLPPRPGMTVVDNQPRPGAPAMQRAPGKGKLGVGGPAMGARQRGIGPGFRMRAAARRAAAARAAGGGRRGWVEPEVTIGESEPPGARSRRLAANAAAGVGAGAAVAAAPPAAPESEASPLSEPVQAEARPAVRQPVAAEPPPPQEERRSAVREAMRSPDELDRLMATAVVQARAASPQVRAPAADRRAEEAEAAARGQARAARPAPAPAAAVAREPVRAPLGRNEIQAVMKDVQLTMNECYRRHGQQGAAEVRIEVSPEGAVTSTLVRGELANTPTASCVDTKLKAAVFPPSAGVTFSYRLMVK